MPEPQDESYRSLDEDPHAIFGAIAWQVPLGPGQFTRVPILFQDTPEVIAQHERNHRDLPGVKIGDLRIGLNEALTNVVAEEITGETPPGYEKEMELLEWLGKDIKDSFVRRYKTDTVQNSRDLVVKIINEFGFFGYVRLMQADTARLGTATDEQLSKDGKARTQVVLDELKKRSSLFRTVRRWF